MVDGTSDLGLGGLIAFIKKTVKVLCVLFFTLVSATLSLQSILATSADSLAMRSVRFAAGNFIPVVGSLVGENAKTLSASFQAIKSECGVLCLIVLFYIILRPILTLAVQKILLSFAGTVGEILGETKYKSLLSSLSSLFDLLMALMISEGCYLVFYITIFINHRGSF
jgi:stage III sporulation protein AE